MTRSAAPDPSFWNGRRVLLTGHTGFKGTWTANWLAEMGAQVTGFALDPKTLPALFDLTSANELLDSRIGDLLDVTAVTQAVQAAEPEIVLHMAAQPIVRRAIAEPVETIAVNVLGTANLLDALRNVASLRAALVVTSDKVYANDGRRAAFVEDDRLGGKDPYSASKAATEIVARSFAETFFASRGVALATARGGNVIGGGDYAEDRIVPDVCRAAEKGEAPVLRMPEATRPWQHVLDCVCGYLVYAEALAHGRDVPRALNFGPAPGKSATVAELTESMLMALGRPSTWLHDERGAGKTREMTTLAVDSSLARKTLAWSDIVTGDAAVQWTADWYTQVRGGADAREVTQSQIARYASLARSAA